MAKTEKKEQAKDIQELVEQLNKQYGAGSVFCPGVKTIGQYDTIPTGSFGIDYKALGIGGFAKGKLYEIRGWEGSNKTTICGHLIANAQKLGMTTLYIDSEHAVDAQYFSQLGVNLDEMMIAQPDDGEEGFDIAEKMMKMGVDLVVIDSDSALKPKKVMESDMGQSSIGRKASLNSEAYPKLKVAAHNGHSCCVVVSQFREKIGVMFGDPRITQGGHALKFTADVIIELSKQLKKDGDETSGTITTFKTLKNKTYTPFKVYKFETIFGKGIDRVADIVNNAIDIGVIEKNGNTYSIDGIKLGVGVEKTYTFFEENEELLLKTENILRERL